MPQGRPKSIHGGTPSEVPNNRLANKRARAGINQVNGSKMVANISQFGVRSVIFFDVPPHHFLDGFEMDVSIILGSILESLLGFVKMILNIVLKLADLCKCTRRRHGSLIREVLAPYILMIFPRFVFSPF